MSVLESGLLNGVDGKINNSTKIKTLEMLGLGVWSEELDIDTLHKRYADDENINLIHGQEIEVLEYQTESPVKINYTAVFLFKTCNASEQC